MELLISENPVRILAQGLTDSKNAFRNIDFDLPFLEMKQLSQLEESFHLEQKEYNSAEIFNQNKRDQFGTVKSYTLKEILKVYQTKRFKLFKIEQVLSVSGYLLKVLKFIEIIDNTLVQIDWAARAVSKRKDFKDKKEKEFVRSVTVLEMLFDLFSSIILMNSDLQSDINNVELENAINEMKENIRLPLSIHYVPDGLVSKISAIFPNLPLSKFSELEKNRGKNLLPKAWNDVFLLEEKLYRIIFMFVENLKNQFSYYVTPEQFLNNPLGKTIFVIPMSMYKLFNFSNSGLYRKEIVNYGNISKAEISRRNRDFLSTVSDVFSKVHAEAEKVKEELEKEADDFDALTFLELFEKQHPVEKTKKVKRFLSDPVVNERVTTMMRVTRSDMLTAAKKGTSDPWFTTRASTIEVKNTDKDTLYFLLELFSLYPCGLKKFPQSEIWRIFNLFSYSKLINKSMNYHVKNYEEGIYTISNLYEARFASILMA